YLIKKDEIDIYDIPIARITKEYLEYVELIELLNLEQAGDFLVMAATLMKIKSQMLLPRSGGEEDEEDEDPREELVRRLLEYQRYAEIALWLETREEEQRDVYYRGGGTEEVGKDGIEDLIPLNLFDLLTAFKRAMEQVPVASVYRIAEGEEVSVEDRIAFILGVLARRERVPFQDMIAGTDRSVMIVTFLALLEVARRGMILLGQSSTYGAIWVYKRDVPGMVWSSPN
ncbi:MAG: segregation/condensation protein A, partial [Candidatus Latescibacteria bacterium]|nr:segregation/condensation protein A [Candidatus Latescibacterota bacterium]